MRTGITLCGGTTLLFAATTGSGTIIFALRAADGGELWRLYFQGGPVAGFAVGPPPSSTIYVTAASSLYALGGWA